MPKRFRPLSHGTCRVIAEAEAIIARAQDERRG
jgi:hypothetical protein